MSGFFGFYPFFVLFIAIPGLEPTSRIELLTSSLPRTRSAN